MAMHTFRSSRWLLLVLAVSVLLAAGIVAAGRTAGSPTPGVPAGERTALPGQPTPTPTPFPFQELTIPYLRSRQYVSSVGEQTKLYETASYTAYMASYLSDGLRINGLLTVPKGEQQAGGYPAIVFVHGYIPPAQYRTRQQYYDYVDYLARNGFVVFKIDLRGHADSAGEAGGGYYSSDYVIDTLNAVAALESLSTVNRSAIGLWGHSMAGNVVMRSFAVKPTIPGVVVWAGAGYTYTDLREFRISDASYRPPANNTERQRQRQLLFDTHGQPSTDSAFWKQVAVTEYLPELRGAVEVHHAVDDAVVHIGYSRNLMQLLDRTAVPHRLYEYASGGHNISGASFGQAMQRTVEFYRTRLAGH